MPIEILMPALSPTMEDGKLAKWMVKEGDAVAPGDVIAEIETDKATMEVEAVDEGTIGRILVGEGTEHVAVNKPIAVLLEEGEGADALEGFDGGGAAPSVSPRGGEAAERSDTGEGEEEPAQATPPAPQPSPSREEADRRREDREPQGKATELAAGRADATTASVQAQETAARRRQGPRTDEPRQPAPRANGHAGRIFASPLAKRIAADNDIDIAAVSGSGPHGRIVRRDVEKALTEGVAPVAPATRAGQVMPAAAAGKAVPAMSDEVVLALYEKGTYEIVPHDNMRRTIAERLTVAKTTIPHFYLTVDCTLDALLSARRRLNDMSPAEGPSVFRISVNDMIIKAMAMALQKVPSANATWTEQGILRHRSSDVGVAVAIDGGLFTPVIRHAEVKSLSEISNEMKDLAERARNRRLAPHEYQGGTTAISNLGMMGIKSFDAVINPPHATILAVGAGERRPVIHGDEIRIATVMSCTLSCDHRVVDGALGAELLDAFKGFIEEPVTMLV